MASPGPKPKVIFGAMTIGKPDTLGARIHSVDEAAKLIDVYQSYGYNEIDTARLYGSGSTEEMLSQLKWKERGLVMATKAISTVNRPGLNLPIYTYEGKGLAESMHDSLTALGSEKVDLFYLHGPDRQISLEDTLKAVNDLHKQGKFNKFGISNYASWEVAKICELCKQHGWIKPSVYQGIYNALQRNVETELFACLREYGIAFYVWSPLAGGFLTGRYSRDQTEFEAGSRFDPKIAQGARFRKRFWNDAYFDGLDDIKAVAAKFDFTVAEVAMRWLVHHSLLRQNLGDAVIIGASSEKHLRENLNDLDKEALPQEVLDVLDSSWLKAKPLADKYFH